MGKIMNRACKNFYTQINDDKCEHPDLLWAKILNYKAMKKDFYKIFSLLLVALIILPFGENNAQSSLEKLKNG